MASVKPRIKVAQVITGLGPGGAERLLLDMAARFDASRFDVRLISIVNDLSGRAVYGHEDIPVAVFDLGWPFGAARLFALRQFMQRLSPDVVHAHMFHALMAAYASSRGQAAPPQICFTSHQSAYPPGRAAIVKRTKAWRAADIIFSEGQHPEMNAAMTTVIPNGVPVRETIPWRTPWEAGGSIKFIAVGRLMDQKDPLGLVRSFAHANLPKATLDFVGSGPLEPELRAFVQSLGLQERVRLLGVRGDVRTLLQGADVFVMHSKYEGMPMALLEAGAEAMPVIATPVGSCPDVLGADCGWLAAPAAFAATLRDVASAPQAAIETGRRLRARIVSMFSIDAAVRAHEALYAALARFQHNPGQSG